jgi:hypothetical protein
MTSSIVDADLEVRARSVSVADRTITVNLEDGRSISVPTEWYPRLKYATPQERANYEISDYGIEWPDVEADFSIRGILLGRRSGENPACFRYWLQNRKRGKRVTVMEWLELRRKARSNKRVPHGQVRASKNGKRSKVLN